jgi:hypothetical protein
LLTDRVLFDAEVCIVQKNKVSLTLNTNKKMKKLLSLAVFTVFAVTAMAQQLPAAAINKNEVQLDVAVFAWDNTAHDFGKIKQGTPVTHEFKFTNTGKTPLVITNVQASCGCTTPDWSKEPVMPGGKGFIKATYNAASTGGFNKTVTVTANIETGFVQLTIKGEVIPTEVGK